jgi:hypothetical protein
MLDVVITQEATWFGKTTKLASQVSVSAESLARHIEFLKLSVDAKELNWFIVNDAEGNLIDAYRS